MESTAVIYWLAYFVVAACVGSLCGNARGCPATGAIAGIVLGPLGWLLTLVSTDQRPRCPECRAVVMPDAQRCCHCGGFLAQDIPEPSKPAAPKPQLEYVDCPACGFPVAVEKSKLDSGIRCPGCNVGFVPRPD